MNTGSVALFVLGLVLLIVGAEGLVRGSSRLARRLGVPSLIIGLTIVAFGTSSPEVLVSVQAAIAGRPDIALGNVVGSNIFNVLFILGVSALVSPLIVSEQLVRSDVPIMIGVSSLAMLFAMNGRLGRAEGALLLLLLVLYVGFLVWLARRQSPAPVEAVGQGPPPPRPRTRWQQLFIDGVLIVLGLVLLVAGSRWLVLGAVEIARALGVSELVIGLTIVAAGTSLPEVATSVVASIRKERDIAVGNIIGSNIFNLLGVLGCAALVAKGGINVPEAALTFDMPVMITVSMACLPVFFAGFRIDRWEGAIFLSYYVAYITFLILDATHHEALPVFTGIMLLFVVPLTMLTFTVVLVRSRLAQSGAARSPSK